MAQTQNPDLNSPTDTSFIKKELAAVYSIFNVQEKDKNLVHLLQEMSRMVLIDELTGLANRFYFDRRLPVEIQNSIQNNEPLSLVSLKIDRFSSINEEMGFQVGDEIIRKFASLLTTKTTSAQGLMRLRYLYTRYCGAHFYIVLPGTGGRYASVGAKRLKQKINHHPLTIDDHQVNITASFGIAEWNSSMKNTKDLLDNANRALQKAIKQGTDQCVEAWTL